MAIALSSRPSPSPLFEALHDPFALMSAGKAQAMESRLCLLCELWNGLDRVHLLRDLSKHRGLVA
jgi:hypothetical protein